MQNGSDSILPAERRKRMVEYIQQKRSGRIEELAAILEVSEATVRRDLDILAEEGLVSRTHGGAVLPESSTAFERLYPDKRLLYAEKKKLIGAEAALLVSDGETLILDSGSTTFEIAQNLTGHKNLTIITYDLYIAGIGYDPSTTVIVTGGMRREGFNILYGPIAEDVLRQIRVDKAFLGADAVDFVHGIANATYLEVPIKRLIIAAARRVILAADASKFGKEALVKVCDVERIHHLITDAAIPEAVIEQLDRMSISTTVAKPKG